VDGEVCEGGGCIDWFHLEEDAWLVVGKMVRW